MDRKRIAIGCQGGGSQCAFVAGALETLFANQIHHRYELVGLSGTSGGALTAAMAWFSLLKEAAGDRAPIADRLLACWRDLTAQTPPEMLLDRMGAGYLRMVQWGFWPSFAISPSSFQFRLFTQMMGWVVGRPEFTDLRALILKHIDFAALPSLIKPQSPVLLVGACDVQEGSFKVFSSVRGEIEPEAVLASAAIPNLFPAVEVRGHRYWDGIFSNNPPVSAFLREKYMGAVKPPDEIWIIQVNPAQYDSIPEDPNDILDRRNHLAGNLSLQHELQFIDEVNLLLQEGGLTKRFRARFGLDTPPEAVKVRFIRMNRELQQGLDYPSKLSRQPSHIARLVADGEAQANAFLAALRDSHELPEEMGAPEVRGPQGGAPSERPS
jgi:NTE family protein